MKWIPINTALLALVILPCAFCLDALTAFSDMVISFISVLLGFVVTLIVNFLFNDNRL